MRKKAVSKRGNQKPSAPSAKDMLPRRVKKTRTKGVKKVQVWFRAPEEFRRELRAAAEAAGMTETDVVFYYVTIGKDIAGALGLNMYDVQRMADELKITLGAAVSTLVGEAIAARRKQS